jgi:hypothetical protein
MMAVIGNGMPVSKCITFVEGRRSSAVMKKSY